MHCECRRREQHAACFPNMFNIKPCYLGYQETSFSRTHFWKLCPKLYPIPRLSYFQSGFPYASSFDDKMKSDLQKVFTKYHKQKQKTIEFPHYLFNSTTCDTFGFFGLLAQHKLRVWCSHLKCWSKTMVVEALSKTGVSKLF